MGIIESFLYGASLPWRALRTIVRSPLLVTLSLLPAGLTLTLYALGFQALQSGAQEAIRGLLIAWGMSPDGITAAAILLLIQLVLILVGAVTFSLVASLISAPLNDFLAEATETRGEPALPAVPSPTLMGRIRLIRIDIFKTLVSGLGLVVAILLSWVPVLNLLGFFVAFLMLTFQFVSYPQTRRGQGAAEGLRFALRHPFAATGFGLVQTGLFALPLISCLALPLAVVGGTLLFARAQNQPRLR